MPAATISCKDLGVFVSSPKRLVEICCQPYYSGCQYQPWILASHLTTQKQTRPQEMQRALYVVCSQHIFILHINCILNLVMCSNILCYHAGCSQNTVTIGLMTVRFLVRGHQSLSPKPENWSCPPLLSRASLSCLVMA